MEGVVPKRSINFLELPGEIRNNIYRFLLLTKHAFSGYSNLNFEKLRNAAGYEFHTEILRVNHQIYNEAKHILYNENLWIMLSIYSPYWYDFRSMYRKRLPLFKDLPARLEFVSIGIDVKIPDFQARMHQCRVLMGLESLDKLQLQLAWVAALGKTQRLATVHVHLGYPLCHPQSILQRQCMEVLAPLWGFAKVNVTGNCELAFSNDLKHRLNRIQRPDDQITEHIRLCIQKGETAAATCRPRTALQNYARAKSLANIIELPQSRRPSVEIVDAARRAYDTTKALLTIRRTIPLLMLQQYDSLVQPKIYHRQLESFDSIDILRLYLHHGLARLAKGRIEDARSAFETVKEKDFENQAAKELETIVESCNVGNQSQKISLHFLGKSVLFPAAVNAYYLYARLKQTTGVKYFGTETESDIIASVTI